MRGRVPQGSILAPLFLLYVNNLQNSSSLFDPIMFANLFYTRENTNCQVFDVNKELNVDVISGLQLTSFPQMLKNPVFFSHKPS